MYENDLNTGKNYNLSQPISDLFKQIGDGKMLAHAGQPPYSVPKLLQIGESNILKIGAYKYEFKDWKKILVVERTLLRFKNYWSKAYAARNDHLQSTAQAHGYHSGNSVTTNTK